VSSSTEDSEGNKYQFIRKKSGTRMSWRGAAKAVREAESPGDDDFLKAASHPARRNAMTNNQLT
jgi:hypothetical protein